MGKIITSPVEKFPGTVTLYDPVPFPAYVTWQKALRKSKEINNSGDAEAQMLMFEGVAAMVEKCDLVGFDTSAPTANPLNDTLKLLAWLVTEIGNVLNAVDDPN